MLVILAPLADRAAQESDPIVLAILERLVAGMDRDDDREVLTGLAAMAWLQSVRACAAEAACRS